jgi:hypothetical protein
MGKRNPVCGIVLSGSNRLASTNSQAFDLAEVSGPTAANFSLTHSLQAHDGAHLERIRVNRLCQSLEFLQKPITAVYSIS